MLPINTVVTTGLSNGTGLSAYAAPSHLADLGQQAAQWPVNPNVESKEQERRPVEFRGIRIEPGVPVPRSSARGKWPFIFSQMNVGDSFVVTGREATNARRAIHSFMRRSKRAKTFISRSVGGDALRIWRTK